MTLYMPVARLRQNDRAVAEARTSSLVDDVTQQYAETIAPPEPSFSLPSLGSLGVSDAPSPITQAIGALPQIGQRAVEMGQQAMSWALPTLESLGVTAPKPEQPAAIPGPDVSPESGTPIRSAGEMAPEITATGTAGVAPNGVTASGGGYAPSFGRGAEGVEQWSSIVSEAAKAYGLPESTIKGLMEIESGGNPAARSVQGAMGLMQVMPFHFGQGEDGMDPRTNIMKGAKVYADALRRYGDPDKAAAAYFGAIDANGNITGATDATGTDGHKYVALFRQAAAKYGAAPNASAAPPAASAAPTPPPPAPAASTVQPAAGGSERLTIRNKRTGFVSTVSRDGWADMTNRDEFEIVPDGRQAMSSEDRMAARRSDPRMALMAGAEALDTPLGDGGEHDWPDDQAEGIRGTNLIEYDDQGQEIQPRFTPGPPNKIRYDYYGNERIDRRPDWPNWLPAPPATGYLAEPLSYRAPLSAQPDLPPDTAAPFLPGDGGTAPTPAYDPRDADQDAHETGYTVPGAVPAAGAAGQVGAPDVVTPSSSPPVAPSQADAEEQGREQSQRGAAQEQEPESPFKPLYDAAGRVIGYVQGAFSGDPNASIAPPDDVTPAPGSPYEPPPVQPQYQVPRPPVQSTGGEPDYVPPNPSVFGPGGILEPAGGGPRIVERLQQIRQNAARELGRSPLDQRVTDDPGWRARNPEMAQEADDLENQLGLVVAGQAGDTPRVGRAAEAPAFRARPGNLPEELTPNIVPPDVARSLGEPGRAPTAPRIRQAIENTEGAEWTPDGLEINVARWQSEDSAGRPSLRGGVFYSPSGSSGERLYEGGAGGYGGRVGVPELEEHERTLFQRPLFVSSGDVGEGILQINAFNRLTNKGAYERLGAAIRRAWRSRVGDVDWPAPQDATALIDDVTEIVAPYGVQRSDVENAIRSYRRRDQTEIAIKESALAEVARQGGYDGIIGVEHGSTRLPDGRVVNGQLGEIFDLRESHLPTPEGGYTLRPEFQPEKPGPISRIRSALDANAERVAAADARMAEQGSTSTLATFGQVPEPGRGRPTLEMIQERLDAARAEVQAARESGDLAAERAASDEMWSLTDQLIDAQNARRAAEPAIESDVGRRIEDTVQPIESIEDTQQAMRPREVVRSSPDDLSGPVSIPVDTSSRLNAGAGTVPAQAPTDRLGAVNRALSQGIASSVSGGVGAQVNQEMNPDDPYAGVKGFAAGALVPQLATRGARRLARAAGKVDEGAGGALATFGAVPPNRQPAVTINGKVIRASSSKAPNLLEIAQAIRMGPGMLGNIGTGLLNALGGPIGVGAGLATEAVRTGIGKQSPAPVVYMAAKMAQGLGEGVRDALGTALGFIPQKVRAAPDFRPPMAERMQGPVGKAIGYAIDTPSRLTVSTPDALFMPIFENGGRVKAATDVMFENGVSRFDPAGQVQEINRLLTNPTPDEASKIDAGAKAFRDEYSFRGDPGYWEQAIGSLFRPGNKTTTAADPMAAQIHDAVGSFLMPFYGGIWKINKLGTSFIPGVGFATNQNLPLGEKVSRQTVGLLFGLYMADRASQGLVTGPGPDDPDEKARLKAKGWDEWATYVPGVGYVKSDNFAEAAPILKAIGAYYDNQRYSKEPVSDKDAMKQGDAIVKRYLSVGASLPPVQAIKKLYQLTQTPIETGTDMAVDAASSFVPATVKAKLASDDPYQREVDRQAGPVEQARQKAALRIGALPFGMGSRQDLAPAVDRRGEPVSNPRAGIGAYIPRGKQTEDEDPLMAEMAANGVNLDRANQELSIPLRGKPSATVPMSQAWQQEWLRARWSALQEARPQVQADKAYQQGDAATRQKIWERVVGKAEDAASNTIKASHQQEIERMLGEQPARKAS